MSEIMNSYEEEREKMASVAMQIVIHAGDGRNLIMEALDCTAEGKYDQAEDKLKDAKEELRQAHIFQTEIVQSEAAGKKYVFPVIYPCPGHGDDGLYGNESCPKDDYHVQGAGQAFKRAGEKGRGQV